MTRIAKRIAGSFIYGVLACGAVSACASEESNFKQDAGACGPSFCPSIGTFMGCCLKTGSCGVDWGNGCVPAKKDSGN